MNGSSSSSPSNIDDITPRKRRPRCAICRSKRFHLSPLGFYICHRGHQQQDLGGDERNDEFVSGGVGRELRGRKKRPKLEFNPTESFESCISQCSDKAQRCLLSWLHENLDEKLFHKETIGSFSRDEIIESQMRFRAGVLQWWILYQQIDWIIDHTSYLRLDKQAKSSKRSNLVFRYEVLLGIFLETWNLMMSEAETRMLDHLNSDTDTADEPNENPFDAEEDEESSDQLYQSTISMHFIKWIDTLVCIYVTLHLKLKIPVTTKDIKSWVSFNQFPYLHALRKLHPLIKKRWVNTFGGLEIGAKSFSFSTKSLSRRISWLFSSIDSKKNPKSLISIQNIEPILILYRFMEQLQILFLGSQQIHEIFDNFLRVCKLLQFDLVNGKEFSWCSEADYQSKSRYLDSDDDSISENNGISVQRKSSGTRDPELLIMSLLVVACKLSWGCGDYADSFTSEYNIIKSTELSKEIVIDDQKVRPNAYRDSMWRYWMEKSLESAKLGVEALNVPNFIHRYERTFIEEEIDNAALRDEYFRDIFGRKLSDIPMKKVSNESNQDSNFDSVKEAKPSTMKVEIPAILRTEPSQYKIFFPQQRTSRYLNSWTGFNDSNELGHFSHQYPCKNKFEYLYENLDEFSESKSPFLTNSNFVVSPIFGFHEAAQYPRPLATLLVAAADVVGRPVSNLVESLAEYERLCLELIQDI